MPQLMSFTKGQFKSIHGKNEVGDKETHHLGQKLVEQSKFASGKTIGRVRTNMQTMDMSESKIEK